MIASCRNLGIRKLALDMCARSSLTQVFAFCIAVMLVLIGVAVLHHHMTAVEFEV